MRDPGILDAEIPPEGDVLFVMPQLADLGQAALATFSQNEEGFFPRVEGAMVDSAAHAKDLACILEEMLAFNRAVESVIERVENNGRGDETLLVAFAVTPLHGGRRHRRACVRRLV
ncbi:MAG: alkaline phosphatase [Opitutales bacterium]